MIRPPEAGKPPSWPQRSSRRIKSRNPTSKRQEYGNLTLTKAIDAYIESRTEIRSPTTIQDYRCIQKNGFQDLMETKLKDLDEVILMEAVNAEARRPSNRRKDKKPISAKRLKNEWGFLTAVLNVYRKDLDYNITLPPVPDRVPELLPAETVLRMVKGLDIDRVDGDIIVPMSGAALYHKWIRVQTQNGIEHHMTFHDLRHLNASVMALLSIPDRYAQDRGGWKSDKVMKKTYMQVFSDERIQVDNIIDDYFENAMQHEMQYKEKALVNTRALTS